MPHQNHKTICGFTAKRTRGNIHHCILFSRMCSGVSGNAPLTFSCKANARMSLAATSEPRAANRRTQCTVGELSLNSATCDAEPNMHTSSMANHRSRRPAISRSELVIVPFVLFSDTRSSLMNCGHSMRNTVGMHVPASPTITPPTPCFEASTKPTNSGHALTSSLQGVGRSVASRKMVRQSFIA